MHILHEKDFDVNLHLHFFFNNNSQIFKHFQSSLLRNPVYTVQIFQSRNKQVRIHYTHTWIYTYIYYMRKAHAWYTFN